MGGSTNRAEGELRSPICRHYAAYLLTELIIVEEHSELFCIIIQNSIGFQPQAFIAMTTRYCSTCMFCKIN